MHVEREHEQDEPERGEPGEGPEPDPNERTGDQALATHGRHAACGLTRKRSAIAIVVVHTVNATALGTMRYQFSIEIP